MRAPFWWCSMVACVLALFVQCASARQQSEDPPASQEIRSQETRQVRAPPKERRNTVPIERESHKGARVAHEDQKGAPAAHESQKSANNQKNEAPGARERRALRDKLNSGLVGVVFGGMDDADFSEAVDLGTVIGNSDIKILSV